MKNFLLVGLLCLPFAAAAQAPTTPPPEKPPDTAALVAHARATQWGGLFDAVIPSSCKHPRLMPYAATEGVEQKTTCRVFVKFSGIPVLPTHRYHFRTWDEAGEEDSLFRIYLTDASWRGIFVQGVCGHRILVEVSYR